MDTVAFIMQKFNLTYARRVEIPNASRNNMGEWFNELGFKVGAEIGVQRGIFSEQLCKSNPGVEHYCIDAYTPYRDYKDFRAQAIFSSFQDEAHRRLAPYNCKFIRKFSLDAAEVFADNSLDYVYIDANHRFDYIIDDLIAWGGKVRSGGIVAGHDYIHVHSVHVPFAVCSYVDIYRLHPLFLIGRHKVVNGEVRDRPRSWMFIRQ